MTTYRTDSQADDTEGNAVGRHRKLDCERKKDAADILVLVLLEERQLHGYEIA